MRPLITIILGTVLAAGLNAAAQETATPGSARVIGLYDIPRLVRSNSLAERQRRIDLRIKRMDVRNQVFAYFPTLDLNYSGSLSDLFRSDRGANSHGLTLSSSWSILAAGDRWLNQRLQKLEYQDLVLANEDSSQQEIDSALILYLDCLKKKLTYESSLSNESISKVQYAYVEARKAQGRASELDILNARAEADNAIYGTASSLLDYELSLTRLSQKLRIGPVEIPENPLGELVPPGPVEISAGTVPSRLSNLIAFKRLELGTRQLKIREILAFRKRFIPAVNAGLDMDWYDTTGGYNKAQSSKGGTVDSLDARLNFSVSLPLFEQNSSLNRWRQGRLNLERQDLALQQSREDREAELLEAVQNHENELLLLPVAERRVESSRLSFEQMAESYKLGVGSLLELTQASQKYRQNQESLTSLKVDLVLLRARIGYLLGDTMKYLK